MTDKDTLSLVQRIEAACTDNYPYGSTCSISRRDAERIAAALIDKPTADDRLLGALKASNWLMQVAWEVETLPTRKSNLQRQILANMEAIEQAEQKGKGE